MSLSGWLRLGWHATLDSFLYWGGVLLFLALLIVSYVSWRVKQREG